MEILLTNRGNFSGHLSYLHSTGNSSLFIHLEKILDVNNNNVYILHFSVTKMVSRILSTDFLMRYVIVIKLYNTWGKVMIWEWSWQVGLNMFGFLKFEKQLGLLIN